MIALFKTLFYKIGFRKLLVQNASKTTELGVSYEKIFIISIVLR